MKLHKIATAIIINLAIIGQASAYNDDLFGNNSISEHNNDVKKAIQTHKKIQDNALENHTINSSVIKEQLSALDSLKVNNNSDFQVTTKNIALPDDNSKNKIQLQEIEDDTTPAILGPQEKVNKWIPLKDNTSKKLVVFTKQKISTENKKTTNYTNATNQFFGINSQITNADSNSLDTVSKTAKNAPTIILPNDLTNLSNSLSTFNQVNLKTSTPESVSKTQVNTTVKNPATNTNPFLKSELDKTKESVSLPKITEKSKDPMPDTGTTPLIPVQNETSSLPNSSLPVSAIPIAGTAMPFFTPPKAIEGHKIVSNLLGKDVYIQIFKKEHNLDLYIKQDGMFKLANIYNICTFSGNLGPKTRMGDDQSPEGFYSADISQMQPNSHYYKAINVGFPNEYDREHGFTGKYLMIHGSCLSAGCYAMTNAYIKEIYAFVDQALKNGQRRVGISIYPFRMTDKNMEKYKNNKNYPFWKELKPGYDYFQATHQVPVVKVENKKYVVENLNQIAKDKPQLFTKTKG